MRTPRAPEALGVFVLVIAMMLAMGLVAREAGLDLVQGNVLSQLSIALMVLAYAAARGFSREQTFSFRWPGAAPMLAAVTASLAMSVVMFGFGPLIMLLLQTAGIDVLKQTAPVQHILEEVGKGGLLFSLAMVAALPAACEEIVFRGLIFSGFAASFGRWKGAVAVAALFGIAHMNVPQGVGVFVLGVHFAAMVILTRSIFAGMAAHFVNNGLLVAIQSAGAIDVDTAVLPAPTAGLVLLCAGAMLVGVSLYAPCILWLRWLRRKADADVPVLTAV